MKRHHYLIMLITVSFFACGKKNDTSTPTPVHENFIGNNIKVNNAANLASYTNVNLSPTIKLTFTAPINHSSATTVISFTNIAGTSIAYNTSFENNDNTVVIQPKTALSGITKYIVSVPTSLASQSGGNLTAAISVNFTIAIDSTDKFSQLSDTALLTLIQQQTFKYFWDFADPTSGLTRERNSDLTTATTGGTGFGIMATVVAVNRSFILRTDAVVRLLKIVNFFTNNVTSYHGAFPHWINGTTGATIPFSTNDNGADLVETSYLMQGLLTARQYFNSTTDANEVDLRNKINNLWNKVEWDWFRQNNQNTLYWHWSADKAWIMNVPINGWNEALITYIMASSSTTHNIPKIVYDNGWAKSGAIKNGKTFYGVVLPLGPDNGGPLFFEQYTFMGVNPIGLNDAYANYQTQTVNHSLINYNYCVANPGNYNGYSNLCWGLTASDEQNGYSAHSPTNDNGTISPTAAISSLPFTPSQSLNAFKFFYYKLGDKLWGQYGFYDAFNLNNIWFANSYLAIDQGPEIIMIENYRSGLLWNLFTSCPEVKTGMKNLGFSAPYL